MKLIKHDSSQMVFRTPRQLFTQIFLLIWGLGFGGIPLFMAFMLVRDFGSLSLGCDRQRWNQVNCQITKSKFFGLIPGESEKFEGIISAKQITITDTDSDGDRTVDHKVTISTKKKDAIYGQGQMYVNGVRGNFSETIFVANSIDRSIGSREMKLAVTHSEVAGGQIFMLFFLSPFILIGWGAIYFSLQVQTLVLDRNQSLVSRRTSLLGLSLSQKSFSLAEANKVIIEDYKDNYDNCYFTPVIVLGTGEKFPLERLGHRDRALIVANQIRQFLYLLVET
jgi:hypothetical protein